MRIDRPGLPLPDSLWAATARPASATPRLEDSIVTDVAIVGGGYTGLSTALHLAESGVHTCVLEAAEPGWGASGRNGGQVNPTLKHDPHRIESMLGPQRGALLIDAIHRSADDVFDLIARHGIECQPVRRGWLQLAQTDRAVRDLNARAEQWRRRGVATEIFDRAAIARRTGSEAFAGGWLDPRAGAIQPLSYARGLVRAAQACGAHVHGGTMVRDIARIEGKWRLATAHGPQVHADRVLIATNGYTGGLWPALAQSVLAANSFIAATEPLAGVDAATILPDGVTASNTQRLLLYFRRDAEGRLLMGGRGRYRDPAGPHDFAHIERSVRLVFPALRDVRYRYRWAGRVALTRDALPHVHQPATGMLMALGYNGRGIATATAMGKHLARLIRGGADFPFPVTPIRPIPLHRLQRLYISAGMAWCGFLDRIATR